MIRWALVCAAVCAAAASVVANAQRANPFEGDAVAVRAGSALFAASCADCHGPDAKGNRGPDLTRLWVGGATDERVFTAIRSGVAGSIMPPSAAPDAEIWAIVAHLRNISTVPPLATTGDSGRGRALFAEHCGGCHRSAGSGGGLGPDLRRIAAQRSREAIVQAIRDPNAVVSEGFRTVTLRTRAGEQVRGALKKEDAFSLQVVDENLRLQGYAVAELDEIVRESGSLMPAFGRDRLSDADVENVLAFLAADTSSGDRGAAAEPAATVTTAMIRDGLTTRSNWLTFSGDYTGQRHSPLTQITPRNVRQLAPQWTFQSGTLARGRGFETTPLVHDGVIYATGANNYAWAIDARSGRPFWEYRRTLPTDLTYGALAPVNRGFAMLGDLLFMVTLDAHLLALDRRSGELVWDVELGDYRLGYAATLAPLVVEDRVIVGISGGEYATRGFLDAYEPATGKRLWRLYTVPEPGDPGSDTWPAGTPARGGATWMTGSYDPALGLLFWGTGNPNPDYYGADRDGDNLYTNSLLAVEARTGRLRWHYQFTPHDTHDWDANHVPVLAELRVDGRRRSVAMVANRNGFFYVLDRTNGELLLGKPFTATTWAREIGVDGRPIVLNEDGSGGCLPDQWGATNFNPPSYDPRLALFFVNARETCATFHGQPPSGVPGQYEAGGVVWVDRDKAHGALRAIDATTGAVRWEFRLPTPTMAGVMSTAAGLVFAGDNEGNFSAFASGTGEKLWHYATGAPIWGAAAITVMLDGRQLVLIPSGAALTAFALPPE